MCALVTGVQTCALPICSAVIVGECVTELSAAVFNGIILVASNPVDLMAMIAFDCAGLPASRIIGTGTLLDSSRLRTLLAGELDVAPGSVDALVLGEHGDSEVGLMSTIRVGGLDRKSTRLNSSH